MYAFEQVSAAAYEVLVGKLPPIRVCLTKALHTALEGSIVSEGGGLIKTASVLFRQSMKLQGSQKGGELTYVLSCLTNEEKLLCLKCLGSRSRANSAGFHTTKLQSWHSLQNLTERRHCQGFLEKNATVAQRQVRKVGGTPATVGTPRDSIVCSGVVHHIKPNRSPTNVQSENPCVESSRMHNYQAAGSRFREEGGRLVRCSVHEVAALIYSVGNSARHGLCPKTVMMLHS